jgi:hypothetical protein
MPVPTLLSRIRKLIELSDDDRYSEIAAGFAEGSLRAPASPMSDRELGEAISEFMARRSSYEATEQLAKRFNRD